MSVPAYSLTDEDRRPAPSRKARRRVPGWAVGVTIGLAILTLCGWGIQSIGRGIAHQQAIDTRQKAEVRAAIRTAGWEPVGTFYTGKKPRRGSNVSSITGQVLFGACQLNVSAYGDATNEVYLRLTVHLPGFMHDRDIVFRLADTKFDEMVRKRRDYQLGACFPPNVP